MLACFSGGVGSGGRRREREKGEKVLFPFGFPFPLLNPHARQLWPGCTAAITANHNNGGWKC